MSNILITGISGYIGQLLLEKLKDDDDCKKIIGIDIKNLNSNMSKLAFYNLDIRSKKIGEIFEHERVDTLIHLAFVFNPTHNVKEMYDINVNGAYNILKNAKKYGIKRILIFSSTTAYGAHKDNPEFLTEETPLRGNRDFCYSNDKAEVEKLCKSFQEESKDIILSNIRPCIVFGPNVENHISRYIARPIIPLIAGYNPDFQLIHEADLANACKMVLEKSVSGTFNIVGKDPIPIKNIPVILKRKSLELPFLAFCMMHELMWQLRIPIVETPSSMANFIRYRWVASGEKAYKVLGFAPEYSAEEALIDFYQKRLVK